MSFELLTSIEILLKNGLSQAQYAVPDTDPVEYKSPDFFTGSIPSPRDRGRAEFEDPGDFPFIINRLVGVDDSQLETMVTVKTIVGIYTEGDPAAGEQEIFNLVSRIRRLFLEKRILDDRFELTHPLKSKFGEEDDDHCQPHPYYGGYIYSQWRISAVQTLLSPEEEIHIYGSGL